MASIPLILMVLALVFLGLATYKLGEPEHLAFGWAGMFFWLLVELLYRGQGVFR